MSVEFINEIAVLTHSQSVVSFSNSETIQSVKSSKSAIPKKVLTALDVAPWGEDNRFPQNIVKDLETCGVAQSTLNWKAKSLWGSGLVYGKVISIDSSGNEVFQVAKKGDFPDADRFFADNNIPRFYAEFNQDWTYFANCFPELIFDKKFEKIAGIVHQESCDCRFKQRNEKGIVDTVLISKLWGASKDQFVKFDPDKSLAGLGADTKVSEIDNKYVKSIPCADMYFPMDSALKFQKAEVSSFILPVNYPSPNKTYYQLVSWDGCRRSGWIEIAAKVPAMLKSLYGKAFNIRYHIEIPETYFENRFGKGEWQKMDTTQRKASREEVLQAMDNFLSGSENAFKSFITYFESDPHNKTDFGRIRITPIKNESSLEKDLLTSGTANSEIMFAIGVNPNILGAGKPGGVYASNQGGSNIREGKLEHDSSLHLERQMILEPLNFIKKFNKWPDELEFRFKDTVLLTLDSGKQTESQIN